jgi:hypothetical protein
MRVIILFIVLVLFSSITAGEESVQWRTINSKINDTRVEVSRYDADDVDWPVVYMWARITYPSPNKAGVYGEIQEWWMNCNKTKGETITYRIYKTKEMEIGKSSELGHFQEKINRDVISEVCKLYKTK